MLYDSIFFSEGPNAERSKVSLSFLYFVVGFLNQLKIDQLFLYHCQFMSKIDTIYGHGGKSEYVSIADEIC